MTYDQWKLRSPEGELCRVVPYDEEPGQSEDCPVCNGNGEVAIFAHDGTQTDYTARCPHCCGFGKTQELTEEMSESPGSYRARERME